MANITDRTAYLRGLAEGMKLDREVNEQRLILEMLDVMDEMSHQLADVNDSVDELNEYVEDIDNDLSDMEDVLFGDDDCDCTAAARMTAKTRMRKKTTMRTTIRSFPSIAPTAATP